jgi:hypothetical protein
LFSQCGYDPLFQRIIGGMNEIGLSRSPDIRAEEDPSIGGFDQRLTRFEIRGHSHERKLMTAQCHEMALPCRPARRQDPDHFQPTDESTTLLA